MTIINDLLVCQALSEVLAPSKFECFDAFSSLTMLDLLLVREIVVLGDS